MITFFLAVALTSSQQAIHDAMERKMSAELLQAKEVIDMEWGTNKQMLKLTTELSVAIQISTCTR